jgi:8-oxo-dGTP pyrophosphatase MutT (NUDIX family)
VVFPGGKIESGESPEQAATRECLEETGLEVRVEHEIGRRNHPVAEDLMPDLHHGVCRHLRLRFILHAPS